MRLQSKSPVQYFIWNINWTSSYYLDSFGIFKKINMVNTFFENLITIALAVFILFYDRLTKRKKKEKKKEDILK